MKGNKMAQQKTCYIIGAIGDPDTSQRKWADFVRKHIINPAVTNCGYEKPARADDPDKGLITQDIIEQMFDADLVVADLTDHNGNVYYELGIRHCAQKPAIHIIKSGQVPLFDLGTNKAIFIGEEHLIVTQAIEGIQSRIKAIKENPKQFYSEVHLHIQVKKLKIIEKSNISMNDAILELFESMITIEGRMVDKLNNLYNELVVKPKQLDARYPIPTLSFFEQILAGQYPHSYAEKFPNLYAAVVREQLEAGNKTIPPSEDKK